jgi:serine protease Do
MMGATAAGPLVGPAAQEQSQPARTREAGQRGFRFIGGPGSWIGVSVRDLGDEEVSKAKLPAPGGVLVEDVVKESPAEKAGVKAGDIIVELDAERVRGTRQFTRLVQETPPGRKVQASVIRDGQRMPLSIEPRESGMQFFGDFPGMPEIARGRVLPPPPPAPPVPPGPGLFEFDEWTGRGSTRLGLSVSDLQPQLAEHFGVKDGVLVTSVAADSPAAKAGVKAGDVITTLNGADVTSSSELRQRTSRLKDGEELSLGLVRDRKPMTVKARAEGAGERRRGRTVL